MDAEFSKWRAGRRDQDPPDLPPVVAPAVEGVQIFHAFEQHKEGFDSRTKLAQNSWRALYRQGVVACPLSEYPRSSKDIGDQRGLPYLKDILQHGMSKAQDEDIIMLTNRDIYLHPLLPGVLRNHVLTHGPASSQRCEFIRKAFPPATASPEVFAQQSAVHPGRDLFAFTKKWLVEKWDDIPDFLLGASEFDTAIAALIRIGYGVPTNTKNIQQSIHPAELARGYVSHQWHQPMWQAAHILNKSPSQIHNRKLMREFTDNYHMGFWYDEHGAPLWNRDTAP